METLHTDQSSPPDSSLLQEDSANAGQKIRTALRTRDTSLGKWAEEHGYKRDIAYYVVRHWAGRERQPLGGIGRQIMADLRAYLGPEIVPDVVSIPNPGRKAA